MGKELCLATDHSSIALEHSRSARTPDLTTDQVLTSKARAPLCLMVLAPKYQAKVQLSLTQPTAKYLARIQNFLKERACRAMAPRSLMILIAIRQVRGRSLINPGRSSLTRELLRKILPFQAMVFSPQVMGPSRTVLALSSQARVLSLNNREPTLTRALSLTHLVLSCQARVLDFLMELEHKELDRISASLTSSPLIFRLVSLIHSLIARILRSLVQVGEHHPIIGGCLIRSCMCSANKYKI